MKKLYYVLFLLLFAIITIETSAQTTYVPDDNFEQALIDLGYDSGVLDDYVPTANISGLTSLNVSSKSISDLTGIEDFTALTELLCYTNQLTSLDVSANTTLTKLYCSSNQLTILDVSANTALEYLKCSFNQLSSIDVSANTNLTRLDCYKNQLSSLDVSANTNLTILESSYNQLTSMDVSLNTALTDFRCNDNQLTILDVSANTALKGLNCSENQLSSVDISANTALYSIACFGNQLSSLDVSANTALTSLYCDQNQLTSLDVSANTALERLYCSSNQLSSLDVSANKALLYLYCDQNQLSSLDISANIALTYLNCRSNQLTSVDLRNGNNANVEVLRAEYNPNLTCIYVDDKTADYLSSGWYKDATSNFVDNEAECIAFKTYVPDNNFEQALIALGYDTGALDDYIATTSIDTITSLDVSNETISDLTGIEDFIALTGLNCSDNQLTELDLSSNTELVNLNCSSNNLISLDVRNGNNTNVAAFDASDNSDLTCIYTDDKTAAYLSAWTKDATASFVNNETECLALNKAPSDITLSNNTIDEGLAIGTTVGTLTATDEDADDTHTFSLLTGDGTNDADNTSFTIDGANLKTSVALDYETKSEYKIYLQTEDAGGLTFEKEFVIAITDLNEEPSNIDLTTNSIDENSTIGSVIGQLSTTDVDDGDSFTYALATGDGTNDADNTSFTIDGANLKTSVALDYETKSEYKIYVQTEDAEGLTFEKAFVINVNDVTETGISTLEQNGISIYPNPTNGIMNLSFSDNKTYTVKIYDLLSKVLFDRDNIVQSKMIDISEYADGVYIMSIQNGDKTITSKIIKN